MSPPERKPEINKIYRSSYNTVHFSGYVKVLNIESRSDFGVVVNYTELNCRCNLCNGQKDHFSWIELNAWWDLFQEC